MPTKPDGSEAVIAPDFSMIASEIDAVMKTMRSQGWLVECLYNQGTMEKPQLFFSHQIKVGDPATLAAEVRRGLDNMDMAFK